MKDFASGRSYVEEVYEKEALPLFIKLLNEGREQEYIDSEISDEAILFYLKMLQEYM